MLGLREGWQSFKAGLDNRHIREYWSAVWNHAWEIWWGAGVIGVVCTAVTLYFTPSRWILGWVVAWVFLVAGYYTWRPYHIRLIPKFEVKQYVAQPTDTFGIDGKKDGWSIYFQLLPKCVTDANVDECRGILTSIEMWDGLRNAWELVEDEAMFLEWSNAAEKPITLYSGGENRLNVFLINNRDRQIMPSVVPFPFRFFTLFNQLGLRQIKAIKFNVKVIAKECPAVSLVMKVQLGTDPYKPMIDLEQVP
jgi:hypothetical protein